MANDLISRKALIADLRTAKGLGKIIAETIVRFLKKQPTVDAVEVVHGRWLSAYEYYIKLGVTDKEKLEDAKKDKWWKFCNGCGQAVKGLHNYCPKCGAKMDGERKDLE